MSMTPEEVASYGQKQSSARRLYENLLANNTYKRGASRVQFDTNMARMNDSYGRQRQQLPQSFLGRGLINSGIYENALSNFNTDRFNAQGDATNSYQDYMNGLALSDQQGAGQYNESLASVDSDMKRRQAEIAANLRAIQ